MCRSMRYPSAAANNWRRLAVEFCVNCLCRERTGRKCQGGHQAAYSTQRRRQIPDLPILIPLPRSVRRLNRAGLARELCVRTSLAASSHARGQIGNTYRLAAALSQWRHETSLKREPTRKSTEVLDSTWSGGPQKRCSQLATRVQRIRHGATKQKQCTVNFVVLCFTSLLLAKDNKPSCRACSRPPQSGEQMLKKNEKNGMKARSVVRAC
jgi:hypothetical protein